MKKTNYILIILFLFLVSCYPYYMETNKNGISKFKSGFTFIYLNLPKGSYAADEKFVRGVDLIFLHDTISKRCFKSYELKNLKKILSQDTSLYDKRFLIKPYPYKRDADLRECVGLFYVCVNRINEQFVNIPLIKLNDTIFVNGVAGVEIDSNTQKYIETCLLEVYDTIQTKKRIDIFMRGRFNRFANRGRSINDFR